jgi:hypothetical protein
METFPHLLDTDLPDRHWQRQTIGSDVARATWIEPDLLPLPRWAVPGNGDRA